MYISNNEITGEGLNWLSKLDWKSLKVIHLHDNRIGDEGCSTFLEGEWPSLKKIELDRNKLSDEVKKRIRQRFYKKDVSISL